MVLGITVITARIIKKNQYTESIGIVINSLNDAILTTMTNKMLQCCKTPFLLLFRSDT